MNWLDYAHKNLFKVKHYMRGIHHWVRPDGCNQRDIQRLEERAGALSDDEIDQIRVRASYYNQLDRPVTATSSGGLDSVPDRLARFPYGQSWSYFLDFKRTLRLYGEELLVPYRFGDVTTVPDQPTIVKSRPIHVDHRRSILMKLNQVRHYYWPKDRLSFLDKKPMLVWRGKCNHEHRLAFLRRYYGHPLCDVGDVHQRSKGQPWYKARMSIPEQLRYRFILSLEGKDVATNLKWIMASNSLCVMPAPRYETWFMEGALQPHVHYVPIADDFSDLEDQLDYYTRHPEAAQTIIQNAHAHVARFQDPDIEDLIALQVLMRYAHLSGQIPLADSVAQGGDGLVPLMMNMQPHR